MATANELLAIARKQIGICENPPNSNCVKYNTWYYGREVMGSAWINFKYANQREQDFQLRIAFVVLYVHNCPHIFVDPACDLRLVEVEFTPSPFDDISQGTRKFLHSNLPQEHSTIHLVPIKFVAILLLGVFWYTYMEKGNPCQSQ